MEGNIENTNPIVNETDNIINPDQTANMQQETELESKGTEWEMPPSGPDHSEEEAAQDTEEKREQVWREEEKALQIEQEQYQQEEQKQRREQETADIEKKTGFLKKLMLYVAHLVRYAVDPLYRSDCRYVASIERRADLKAQAKDYEQRRAEKLENDLNSQKTQIINEHDSDKEKGTEIPNVSALIAERTEQGMNREEAIISLLKSRPELTEYLTKRDLETAFYSAVYQCNEQQKQQFGFAPLQLQEIHDLRDNLIHADPSYDKMWKIVEEYYRLPEGQERTTFMGNAIVGMHSETRSQLETAIQNSMEINHFNREQAIMAEVSIKPNLYRYLKPEDQTQIVQKTAYDALLNQTIDNAKRNHKWADKTMEDPKFRNNIYRTMLINYPQIVAAVIPEEVQRRLIPSVVIRNPKTAAYLNPELGNDQKTAHYLVKALEQENQRRQEQNQPQIEKINLVQQLEHYPQGAAGTLAAQIKQMWGIEEPIRTSEPIQNPDSEHYVESDHKYYPEPELKLMQDYDLEYYPELDPEYYMESDPEVMGNSEYYSEPEPNPSSESMPEPEQVDIEPQTSWYEQDTFKTVVAEAKQTPEAQLHKTLFHSYDYELIKQIILERNPELYEDLPEAEKNLNATLTAVTNNISLMRYVPEDPCIEPDYGDRETLKQEIIKKIEDRAIQEARETKVNVQYVIKNKYGKDRAGDTLEVKEMKKELRSRSFDLQERSHSLNHDDLERE